MEQRSARRNIPFSLSILTNSVDRVFVHFQHKFRQLKTTCRRSTSRSKISLPTLILTGYIVESQMGVSPLTGNVSGLCSECGTAELGGNLSESARGDEYIPRSRT